MCGRAALTVSADDLRTTLGLDDIPRVSPRFNIAPTQPITVVRTPRRLELLRWGLLLPGQPGARGINVRLESVARASAYRESFRKRRCLVVVDGFYEWQRRETSRQPFFVRRQDRKPFALAGIWSTGTTADGEIVDACAIITGGARGALASVHDRMPVIISPNDYDRWIDPAATRSLDLLAPASDGLVMYAVSARVNSPANDDARCVESVDPS